MTTLTTTIVGPNGPIPLFKARLPDLLVFGSKGEAEALAVVKELIRRREKKQAKRAERLRRA